MATPLSVYNLIHGGWRTVLSIVGISIAIVLIFMQLGFLGAVTDTAVVFYDEMEFDLAVCSPDYYNFVDSGRFDRNHMRTVYSHPAVTAVFPIHVSLGKWNYESQEVQRGILIMGVDPHNSPFSETSVTENLHRLVEQDSLLMDRTSRPAFLGANRREPIDENSHGITVELNGTRCRLRGLYEIGTGLAADGATLVNEALFQKLIPGYTANQVGLALIQLKPEADRQQVKSELLKLFPPDQNATDILPANSVVDVLTRDELQNREIAYWQWGTPIGFIFLLGSLVAFIVGAIIVYIVLSSDIAKQIGEYATLKAMGYRNAFLANTVLEQAFILAAISYICAAALSLVLYQVVGDLAKLPITMTITRLGLVLASSLLMSFVSAMIAMQKLRQADPADLF